jgi:protein involved in polysaccharide export with SLBB domain
MSERSPLAARCAPALLALVASLSLAACATPKGPPISQVANRINATLTPSGAVTLSPGDTIEVRFPYSSEWNQEVTIYPDGNASFLRLDKLPVAGLLLEQLDEQLTAAYAPYIENPELTVILRSLAARSVTIAGEVASPGAIDLPPNGRLTLVEAFSRAGGHRKDTAYLGNTILIRWDPQQQKQVSFTIDARPEHWVHEEPIYLQHYDIVYVPNTPVDEVNIWIDKYIRQMLPVPFFLPIQ